MARQIKHEAVVYVRHYGESDECIRIVKLILGKQALGYAVEVKSTCEAYDIAMDMARDNGNGVRISPMDAEYFARHATNINSEWTITNNPFRV